MDEKLSSGVDLATRDSQSNGLKMDTSGEWSTEDCTFLLRTLEVEAFSLVVSAMRAQGMLTEYKEVLLDHLKSLFSISDERYAAELRRAGNDSYLCRIAKKLNPSYDCFAEWACASASPTLPTSAIPTIPASNRVDMTGEMQLADQLLRMADIHNEHVDANNAALMQLIELPKRPLVPERLRAVLRLSEEDSDGRLLPKSPRKGREYRRDRETMTSPVGSGDGGHALMSRRSVSPATTWRLQQEARAAGFVPIATSHSPIFNGNGSIASSTSIKGERNSSKKDKLQNGSLEVNGKLLKTRKRCKASARDNATCTCARVQPFLFEAAAPGQKMKPPRGNPDRRTAKRPSPTSAPAFLASSGSSVSAQSTAFVSTGRNVALSPNTPNRLHMAHYVPAGSSILKRHRSISSGEMADVPAVYGKQLTERNADYMKRPSQQLPRGYVRPIASVPVNANSKFYVAAAASTTTPTAGSSVYSNPARPYYGNPSAAAMGITVRSGGNGNDKPEVQHMIGHDYSSQQAPVLMPAVHMSRSLKRPAGNGGIVRALPQMATIYGASSSSRYQQQHAINGNTTGNTRPTVLRPSFAQRANETECAVAALQQATCPDGGDDGHTLNNVYSGHGAGRLATRVSTAADSDDASALTVVLGEDGDMDSELGDLAHHTNLPASNATVVDSRVGTISSTESVTVMLNYEEEDGALERDAGGKNERAVRELHDDESVHGASESNG